MSKYISIVYRPSAFETYYMSGDMLESMHRIEVFTDLKDLVEGASKTIVEFQDGAGHDVEVTVIIDGEVESHINEDEPIWNDIWDAAWALSTKLAQEKLEQAKAEKERQERIKIEAEIALRDALLKTYPLT